MSTQKRKYNYRFIPSGETEEQTELIKNWLNSQARKSASISFLILQAIQKYGNNTDVIHMTTQAFINDEIHNQPTSTAPSEPKTPEIPAPATPSESVAATSEKTDNRSDSSEPDSTEKPNFGFLSK